MLGDDIHQVFLVPLTVFGRSASLFILDFCVFVRVFPIAIKFFFFVGDTCWLGFWILG
jgi:hypothetical protein